jgi:DNA repair protein RecN (Recombination protein N)
VAAGASSQFKIEKVTEGNRAVTRAIPLDEDARQTELARMLSGGEVTDSALAHARSLLDER